MANLVSRLMNSTRLTNCNSKSERNGVKATCGESFNIEGSSRAYVTQYYANLHASFIDTVVSSNYRALIIAMVKFIQGFRVMNVVLMVIFNFGNRAADKAERCFQFNRSDVIAGMVRLRRLRKRRRVGCI